MLKNILTGCMIAAGCCTTLSTALAETTAATPSDGLQQLLQQANNSKLQGGLEILLPQPAPMAAAPTTRAAPANAASHIPFTILPPETSNGYVVIDAIATHMDATALTASLNTLGMQNTSTFGRTVSGRFPVDKLPELASIPGLQFARAARMITHDHNHTAKPDRGLVQSQGVKAMQADSASKLFRVNGKGVAVGALSDSYNCLGGAPQGVANGELPADMKVIQEGFCELPNMDEGRALLEIVHDVAPASPLLFHTSDGGQANFAQGILDLANAGAKVIVDDAFYPSEPMFQDGIISQAIDKAKSQGVAYFSAAGNYGRESSELAYSEAPETLDLSNIGIPSITLNSVDFNPATGQDSCLELEIPAGGIMNWQLQWDEPFASAGGAGASNDLGLLVYVNAGCQAQDLVGFYGIVNQGADALEKLDIDNRNSAQPLPLGIRVVRLDTSIPPPGKLKAVAYGGKITDTNITRSSTINPHANSRGGMGVGAAYYKETPAFGIRPAKIEPYSSAGGTLILFDTAGNRLTKPEPRQQPAIVGPDGVDTSFFGSADIDQTGYLNFLGTSAAAPHVAGVAALMRQLNPRATPDTVYQILKRSAKDMDDPYTSNTFDRGFDYGTGYGFIDAMEAVAKAHSGKH